MIPVPEGCPRAARAERGVHAASPSKMKAGWNMLAPWLLQRAEARAPYESASAVSNWKWYYVQLADDVAPLGLVYFFKPYLQIYRT